MSKHDGDEPRRRSRSAEWKRRHELLRDTYGIEREREAIAEAVRLVLEGGVGLLSATVRAGAPSSAAVVAKIKDKDPAKYAEIMLSRAEGGYSDDV